MLAFVQADRRWRRPMIGLHLRQQVTGWAIVVIVRVLMCRAVRTIHTTGRRPRLRESDSILVMIAMLVPLMKEQRGSGRPKYERREEEKIDAATEHGFYGTTNLATGEAGVNENKLRRLLWSAIARPMFFAGSHQKKNERRRRDK